MVKKKEWFNKILCGLPEIKCCYHKRFLSAGGGRRFKRDRGIKKGEYIIVERKR